MARRKSEPPAYQNDLLLVRLNWSVICSDVWVSFYFSIKSPCIVQLRRPCDHFWHHWYKLHQDCSGSHIVGSRCGHLTQLTSGQSLPLQWNIPGMCITKFATANSTSKLYLLGITINSPQNQWNGPRGASKKISESIRWIVKFTNCISAGRFSEQCREQRSSDKVPDQSPDTWLSRCPTSKIRCCFHGHIFALGVLDAPNVVVGNDRDLLVEVIVMAPVNAKLYMLRHSNSNTTFFDITRLPNSVGRCNIDCSPYTLWLLVTLPRSYNQRKI